MDVHPIHADQPPDKPGQTSGPMSVPTGYRPAKAPDVLELDMGDGLILYNHDSSLVHHLNPSAALLWQLCDGEASVGELATEISQEYGLGDGAALRQISAVIAEFDALDLVEDARNLLRRKDGTDR
jgi:PqqD family protein of HPr-rel-A system